VAEVDFSRPVGFSPHFSVHVIGERELMLLSEQRSFRLSGRLYVALVPHLDGTRTFAEILDAFSGRTPEARLRETFANMTEKGYVSYVDRQAPVERQALWAELGLSPADAELNLSRFSLGVRSLPDGAGDVVADLLRNAARSAGLRLARDEDADLTVVCVQDYLHRDLDEINRSMRHAGRSWLLFKAGGSQPSLGPWFRPQGRSCWACLARQLLENRPGDRLVDAAHREVRPARAYNGATLGFATSAAALELARAVARGDRASLDAMIIGFDVQGRGQRTHHLRLDPHCAVCGTPHDPDAALAAALMPLQLQSQRLLDQSDGGWRVASAADVVKRLGRYVSPLTGIIDDLKDTSPQEGLPVFAATQANPVPTGPRANRLIGRPGAAAGKGAGEMQARASCLGEAIERYLFGFTGHEPRTRAHWSDLGSAAPHPNRYLQFSERQFDIREAWNARHSGFNWTGERFDEGRAIEWTPAWSLTHGERRWLPMRFCYYRYIDSQYRDVSEENEFCSADSNGCASGSTLEEAILQGFLELVERDACALWWYNRLRRPAFDLTVLDDPFVRRAEAHYARHGRKLHVLDLTNDIGIPVAIALSYGEHDGRSIVLGLGAHLDARLAVNRAIAEMNQTKTLEADVTRPVGKVEADEAVLFDWLTTKSLDTERYCVPEGLVDPAAYPRPRFGDLKEAVDYCLRLVSDRGFDMIVHDARRPEIDFAAARVVVPGLRHFWARFREGRLYQTPVGLGWLDKPLAEQDLNPTPFFL
jgi:ribosomal protein S12 methylthiotransferase accessory factor